MARLIMLTGQGVNLVTGSSKPICPYDGRVCDGEVILGAPSCCVSTFGVVRGREVVCPRFKSNKMR
jgi:hypothetical protein